MAIQIRRGTKAEWNANNSNIIAGEPVIALDTGEVFVGTGAGTYVQLAKNKDVLTDAMKVALMHCFENVAWSNANGQTYVNELRTALGIVPVSGISLSSVSGTIYRGYSKTVTVSFSPANATDKSFSVQSSNTAVATAVINDDAITINGISDGSAVISVYSTDGNYLATYTATVQTAVPTSITLNHGTISGRTGTTATLTATVLPTEAENKTLTWTSSNTSIVRVTPSSDTLSCTVSFIAVGTATITATSNVGSATKTCTATAVDVTLTPITPTVKICSTSGKFEYAYYADTKAELDTSDPSQCKNQSVLGRGALVFDCRGLSQVRIRRYIADATYTSHSLGILAFNNAPSYDFNYNATPSASGTTDASYKFVDNVPGSQYISGASIGDLIDIGDYTVDPQYPYLVAISMKDMTTGIGVAYGASTDIANFRYATDIYTCSSRQDGIQINSIT